ncbi:MAG: hypothetical protein H0U52_01705 [Chloroflexi bacterium]|nr:hypothetical protein [Chloroflexota bacterium]
MIHIECTWCDAELVLASLDAPSVHCPDCRVTVEFSPEPEAIALAA